MTKVTASKERITGQFYNQMRCAKGNDGNANRVNPEQTVPSGTDTTNPSETDQIVPSGTA